MTITINIIASPHPLKPVPKKKSGHTAPNAVVAKTEVIFGALLAGQRLTVRDAAFKWDLYCLAGLVYHLRRHRDVPVKTKILESTHPDGYVTQYAEYFLTAQDIAEIKAKKVPPTDVST